MLLSRCACWSVVLAMRSSLQAPRTSRPVVSAINDVASFMTGTPCCGSGQRRSDTNDGTVASVPSRVVKDRKAIDIGCVRGNLLLPLLWQEAGGMMVL